MPSSVDSIVEIRRENIIYAVVIPSSFHSQGVKFCTPDSFSQQLAYMCHPAGKVIPPHFHNTVKRDVHFTLEVLFIKKGRLRVDFYDHAQVYLESRILSAGDVILLSSGGHGFKALDDLEMIEVKQGPYVGDKDKTRFEGAQVKDIHLQNGESL
jgi:mannose-6-phosphate isomerase-like protein (cupin superfamily)